MAYKKYIKKGGKTYGPYTYHSKRVDGKVVSEYHGVKIPSPHTKFFWIFSGFVLVLLLIYGMAFFNTMTGRVTVDLEGNYEEGQPIDGTLTLSLKQGELIPASSTVIFKTADQQYEYLLQDLVAEDFVQGDFYIEGTSITGTGDGYGEKGIREVYPVVYFTLNVYSQKGIEKQEKDSGDTSGGGTEIVDETPEEPTETIPEEETEEPVEETPEESVEEPTETIPEEETEEPVEETPEEPVEEEKDKEEKEEKDKEKESKEEITEETTITGGVIANLFERITQSFLTLTGRATLKFEIEVSGETSKENPFTYPLEEGQTAEIKSGSVRTNLMDLSDNGVNLDISGSEVTVTTSYSEVEQGFGEGYLLNYRKDLIINLSDLNLVFDKGELEVDLLYEQDELISLSTPLEEGEIVATETSEDPIIYLDEIDSELGASEKKILSDNFGNISVRTSRFELVNDRLIVRFEIGEYWVDYSYEYFPDNIERIKSQIRVDRVKWLKDLAKELTKEEVVPKKVDIFVGDFEL